MNELLLSELRSEQKELLPAIALIEDFIFSGVDSLALLEPFIADCNIAMEDVEGSLDRAERFINQVYVEQLFIDNHREYWSSMSFTLGPAIEYRDIAPILKAVVITHIAVACGFNADIVFVPEKAMVRIICDEMFAIIFDPVTGESLNGFELDEKLDDIEGDPQDHQLNTMDKAEVIALYLTSLKTALIRELNYDSALKCVDILLAMRPNDPNERRDRGFLLQQLDCFKVAYDDYRYFVEQCPKDPVAQLLKIQLDNISVTETVLH